MRYGLKRWILLGCVSAAGFAWAGDWPQFRGPKADGMADAQGVNLDWNKAQPKKMWQIELGDKGFAGPSIADGKLFVIDHQGKDDIVRAVDMATGQDVWKFTYEDTGKENFGFARATPTFDNGKIYTVSRTGWVHCLDAKTGQKVWAKNLMKDFGGKKPQWDFSMSAAVDGDRLVLIPGADDGLVAVVNKVNGELIWKGGGSEVPGYATPVIATINGVKQYVIFSGTSVVGVAAEDGKRLWSFPWKTDYDVNAAMPIVIGNTVFISSGYKAGCALLEINGGQATEKWRKKEMQAHFSTPVLYKGNLYGTTDPGDLICLDPATGKTLWRQGGFEKGGSIGVGDTIIAMNGKGGDVVAVKMDPAAYSEVARIKPLGGQSWTAPILADGKLIIRNTKALVCLDVSGQ